MQDAYVVDLGFGLAFLMFTWLTWPWLVLCMAWPNCMVWPCMSCGLHVWAKSWLVITTFFMT
ncbi:hypothetical protein Lalb_Chr03g0031851 [Lupinus albus]|uniref:Uncharacterized protein n=1 Tax=Lupinus albus TaxID=3870 RepID=A0A6A4QSS6_LUPAL|nr:hypothetical protein Lalb_Chr03g0031851 [Lupinus albus]